MAKYSDYWDDDSKDNIYDNSKDNYSDDSSISLSDDSNDSNDCNDGINDGCNDNFGRNDGSGDDLDDTRDIVIECEVIIDDSNHNNVEFVNPTTIMCRNDGVNNELVVINNYSSAPSNNDGSNGLLRGTWDTQRSTETSERHPRYSRRYSRTSESQTLLNDSFGETETSPLCFYGCLLVLGIVIGGAVFLFNGSGE